jgi:hypothetical protein
MKKAAYVHFLSGYSHGPTPTVLILGLLVGFKGTANELSYTVSADESLSL